MVAGVLATGGGIVFTGDAEGFFTAYETQTGKVLWTFQCGSGHHSGPITYSLDGRQYVAVCVGWGGWTAGFVGDGAPGCATLAAETPCSSSLSPRRVSRHAVTNPTLYLQSLYLIVYLSSVERLRCIGRFQSAVGLLPQCSRSSRCGAGARVGSARTIGMAPPALKQGFDGLRDTRVDAAERSSCGWHSSGHRRGRGPSVGRMLGRRCRISLVCECGLRVALPP